MLTLRISCNQHNMSTTLKDREDFIFKGSLSELPLDPKTEEQIETSLFKNFKPKEMIDAYERQLGITVSEPSMPKLRYKHIMLSPGVDEEEGALLDKLMNDPELYQIVNRDKYWTPRGELKIWIEYTENLDVKKEREAKKEKTTNES